jgi:hypothetical protein
MLQTKDQLQKDSEYFLPEDIAHSLAEQGLATVLVVGGEMPIGPSETKPAAPPELKALTEPDTEPPEKPEDEEEEEEEPEPEREPEPPHKAPPPHKPEPVKPAKKAPAKKHAHTYRR